MERGQFTFYRSFWEALKRLPQKDRLSLFDAICAYALDEEERNMTSGASAAFILIRPNLDSARRKSAGGKKSPAKNEDADKMPERYAEDNSKINQTMASAKQEDAVNKKEKEKEKEKELENECYISCPEPPLRSAPAAFSLPLNDGSLFPLTQQQIDEWCRLYPAVDVMQQLRNMTGWLNANPAKRKTKSGILRFVNAWLSKEQDRGGAAPQTRQPSRNQPTACNQYHMDPLVRAAVARLNAMEEEAV